MARLIKDQSPGTINVTFKIIFVTFSPQKCKFYEKNEENVPKSNFMKGSSSRKNEQIWKKWF